MKKFLYPVAAGVLTASFSFSVFAEETTATDLALGMAWDQDLSVVVELDNQY